MEEGYTGKIVHLNDKGYGFISVAGIEPSVFFHAKDVRHVRYEQLRKNDKVSIGSIVKNDKGYTASDVFLVS